MSESIQVEVPEMLRAASQLQEASDQVQQILSDYQSAIAPYLADPPFGADEFGGKIESPFISAHENSVASATAVVETTGGEQGLAPTAMQAAKELEFTDTLSGIATDLSEA